MTVSSSRINFRHYNLTALNQSRKTALLVAFVVVVFTSIFGYFGKLVPALILGAICLAIVLYFYRHYTRNYLKRLAALKLKFPPAWQEFLEENSLFYQNLSDPDKLIFNQRVQLFLGEKKVEGVSTEIDDNLKLLVAASAIIPTFAFPYFEYPNLKQVLLYPNAFDRDFQTGEVEDRAAQNISGMVGNGFMNGTLLLSKTELINGFKGKNKHNVGIHEFVHLLDMADGAVDGLPEIFLAHSYTIPWLKVIKNEVEKIKKRKSDINPYGLTNNAEFLAVVSEYFFDNPEKFQERHPELYRYLCAIFQQRPDHPASQQTDRIEPETEA